MPRTANLEAQEALTYDFSSGKAGRIERYTKRKMGTCRGTCRGTSVSKKSIKDTSSHAILPTKLKHSTVVSEDVSPKRIGKASQRQRRAKANAVLDMRNALIAAGL